MHPENVPICKFKQGQLHYRTSYSSRACKKARKSVDRTEHHISNDNNKKTAEQGHKTPNWPARGGKWNGLQSRGRMTWRVGPIRVKRAEREACGSASIKSPHIVGLPFPVTPKGIIGSSTQLDRNPTQLGFLHRNKTTRDLRICLLSLTLSPPAPVPLHRESVVRTFQPTRVTRRSQ